LLYASGVPKSGTLKSLDFSLLRIHAMKKTA